MTNAHTITDIILLEVLERMNLSDMPEGRYEEYKAKLGPIIEDRIVGALLESLTPEERTFFSDLSDKNGFSKEAMEILFANEEKFARIEKELTVLVSELSQPL